MLRPFLLLKRSPCHEQFWTLGLKLRLRENSFVIVGAESWVAVHLTGNTVMKSLYFVRTSYLNSPKYVLKNTKSYQRGQTCFYDGDIGETLNESNKIVILHTKKKLFRSERSTLSSLKNPQFSFFETLG